MPGSISPLQFTTRDSSTIKREHTSRRRPQYGFLPLWLNQEPARNLTAIGLAHGSFVQNPQAAKCYSVLPCTFMGSQPQKQGYSGHQYRLAQIKQWLQIDQSPLYWGWLRHGWGHIRRKHSPDGTTCHRTLYTCSPNWATDRTAGKDTSPWHLVYNASTANWLF